MISTFGGFDEANPFFQVCEALSNSVLRLPQIMMTDNQYMEASVSGYTCLVRIIMLVMFHSMLSY